MLADWLWEEEEEEREGRRGVEGAAEEQKKYKKMKEGMGKPEGGCGGEGGGMREERGRGGDGRRRRERGGNYQADTVCRTLIQSLGQSLGCKTEVNYGSVPLVCVTVATIRQREKGPAVKKSCISLAALAM